MMRRVPRDLVAVADIDRVTLPNEPAAHRLIDRLRDAQATALQHAVNE